MAGTFKFKSLETTDSFTLRSLSDRTKAVTFDLSGITSGQTRSLTIPNKSGTIALLDDISGGVSAIGTSAADVFSVSGSDLVADDGGTVDSADPFIKWDDTAGKLVYANPLSRPTGAFYVGLAPTTTALGTNAVNIQSGRSSSVNVASGGEGAVGIGFGARASGGFRPIAIGYNSSATAWYSLALGAAASSTANYSVAIGSALATAESAIAICGANSFNQATASAIKATSIGYGAQANLRGQFSTYTFNSIYWGGQTTDATPTILNLDATATNRFTIAANTLIIADLLIAANSTGSNKALVARRWVAIRRDNSNNTTLVGIPQAIGTDQSTGSPTWDFNITADDTNEALQFEAIGATDETITWRVTAFYRVA